MRSRTPGANAPIALTTPIAPSGVQRKHTRHWSLTRMLSWPALLPRNRSSLLGGRNGEVAEAGRCDDALQPHPSAPPEVGREPSNGQSQEEPLCILVLEAVQTAQDSIASRYYCQSFG